MAKIRVYIDDGRIFCYEVSDEPGRAREHAGAIASGGYRHKTPDGVEYYPAHRIVKVKVVGKDETGYPDTVSGT